jgi:hypothetical protein
MGDLWNMSTTFMSFFWDNYNMTIDIFFWDRWFADPLGTK